MVTIIIKRVGEKLIVHIGSKDKFPNGYNAWELKVESTKGLGLPIIEDS